MNAATDPAQGDTVRWTERRDGQLRTLTGTVHAAHPDRWLVNLGAGKYYDLRRELWEGRRRDHHARRPAPAGRGALMTAGPAALLPTLPGMVSGIVGMDPLTLQCHDCGDVTVRTERTVGAGIILSGFRFHICEGRGGVRRCPACLAAVKATCERAQCRREI